ncbi:DA1-related 1-like protein [Drosera capensis]
MRSCGVGWEIHEEWMWEGRFDNESQVVEDELLAKALQESMNIASAPRNVPENIVDPYLFFFNSVLRQHAEIGYGRYLSRMGKFWHPE